MFAGASRVGNGDDFPHDLGYVADGVIDLALSEELVEATLMKRIRVRKMSGVLSIRRWATYEFAESEGLVAAGSGDDEGAAEESGDGGDTEDAGEGTQPDTGDDVATTPDDRDPNGNAATGDPPGRIDPTADAPDAEDR